MFVDGVVKTYNAERGFGFISVDGHKKDIFFHITDFPNRNISPNIGERLKFSIFNDNGRMKAIDIIRLDLRIEEIQKLSYQRPQNHAQISKKKRPKKNRFNFINFLVGFFIFSVFLAILIPFLSGIYKRETLKRQIATPTEKSSLSQSNSVSKYSCDGRIHCSEMKSYDEALFFINNCPGTKMDGDGDGDPCEGQFR